MVNPSGPIDVDALLEEITFQEDEQYGRLDWIAAGPDGSGTPSIGHRRVRFSTGGGACPEQHYGVLIDGRFFYFRYRHGRASLQVLHRPTGRFDLPVVNKHYDAEAARAVLAAGELYTDSPWEQPCVSVRMSDADDGWFQDSEELVDAFNKCLELVDEYDKAHGVYDYGDHICTMCICGDNQVIGQGGRFIPHRNRHTGALCPPSGTISR